MGGLSTGGTVVQLVCRARAGDVDAFDELYRLTLPKLRGVAAAVTSDTDTAAEIVQETYLRAFERVHELRSPDRFPAWIASIARHLATDHGRLRSRASGLDEIDLTLLEAEGPGPDAEVELAELAALVQAGVAQLSRRDATALAFVTHLGMGPSEFADALGVNEGAARVILHRARTRLRDILSVKILTQGHVSACAELRDLRRRTADKRELTKHVASCRECAQEAAGLVSAGV